MAFNFQPSANRRPGQWQPDPSQLTTSTPRRQPSYSFDYRAQPGGGMQIRRQTTAQANLPPIPATTPSMGWGRGDRVMPDTSRVFQIAQRPAGYDPTGSQFPWQLRTGISSDASRQRAFQSGFGSGEGRTGFARRATDTFFDPRYMFDPSFQRWETEQRQRRLYA